MDGLNLKQINHLLRNGRPNEVKKLKKLLDQINLLATTSTDVCETTSCDAEETSGSKPPLQLNDSVNSDLKPQVSKENRAVDNNICNRLTPNKPEFNPAPQPNISVKKDVKAQNSKQNLLVDKEIRGRITSSTPEASSTSQRNRSHNIMSKDELIASGDSKILSDVNSEDEVLEINQFQEPLERGWKRETIVNHISKQFHIEGDVTYYAPGSNVELKDIGQIQAVLEKKSFNLTTDNFTFSTRPILGTFLQKYDTPTDAKFWYLTDVAMAKRLKTYKFLKLSRRNRKIPAEDNSKANDDQKESVNEENEESEEKGDCESTSYNMDVDDHDGNESIEIVNENLSESKSEEDNTESEEDNTESEEENTNDEIDDDDEPTPAPTTFKLIQIDDSNNFYDEEGFLYSKNNSKQIKNSYFRCKNSTRFKCRCRVKATDNNFLAATMTRIHNHLPFEKRVHKEKFDKKLIKVCNESPFLYPRELYAKTRKALKNEVKPINIPLKSRYSSLIQRKRRKFIPKLPKTIEEFEEWIEDYKKQYYFDERDLPFYRKVWKTKNGESNIVFISESVLLKLKEIKDNIKLIMDGTFKVLPRHIKFRQLYIISLIFEGRCYPLAYILMQTKTTRSYNLIFSKLKDLIPLCNITDFMTDYEAATRKAISIHFPSARLAGCYFHYVKAIKKVARKMGLSKDEKFHDAIEKVSALALLPNNFVTKGFRSIDRDRDLQKSVRWSRFKKYWCRQWRNANISVHGLEDRTNNFAESLNKSLNVLTKTRHPNIWILIEHLKTLEMDKTDELEKHSEGLIFKKKESSEAVKRLNQTIDDAYELFEKELDVAKFLQRVKYSERFEDCFNELIFLEGVDDYEDDEDEDFEIELFLPNTFNEKSNFEITRTTLKRKSTDTNEKSSKKQRK